MSEKMDITVMPGDTKASITVYSRGTTLEDIRSELEDSGIVEGLKWDTLEETFNSFKDSEKESFKVVFAETEEPGHLLYFGNREIDLSKGNPKELETDLRTLYSAISGEKQIHESPECIFVTKGNIFCKEQMRGELTDVYGGITTVTLSEKPLFRNTPSIDTREKNENLEYSATCDGYVVITPEGDLDIMVPTLVSQDNMEMFFTLAPVSSGKEELVDCFYKSADTKDDKAAVELPEKDKLTALLDSGKISKFLVRKGIRPKQGKDARLSIKASVEKRPSEDDFYMDLKEFSTICEITEGALIAEKIPTVEGIAGRNIYNDVVPAEPVNDVPFHAGDNVEEQDEENIIRYVASCNGILSLSDKGADVSEALQVKGDVGVETGNINFSKSITIEGDVLGGYRIECGGDLIVKGSINDGAIILCRKNMFVTKGIHGHSTDITVNGNAETGFIQESRIHVNNNLTVLRSIVNSKVFCGGALVVEGKGVSGDKRGCVIGGEITAMKSIEVDSVGSETNNTRLVCGFNQEVLDTIKAVKRSLVLLNKRTTRLRSEIGIDLKRPDAAAKLKKLPAARKNMVKKLMFELREVAGEQKNFQEKLPLLKKKALPPEPEKCAINVKKRLFPYVGIQICNAGMSVTTQEVNMHFILKNGKVVNSTLTT